MHPNIYDRFFVILDYQCKLQYRLDVHIHFITNYLNFFYFKITFFNLLDLNSFFLAILDTYSDEKKIFIEYDLNLNKNKE